MNLYDAELTVVDLPMDVGADMVAAFDYAGDDYLLVLRQHSLRSPDFRVRVQGEDGKLREVEVPAPQTYRGLVLDHQGSQAAVSLVPGGIQAQIRMADGQMIFVEPLSKVDPEAAPDLHVVYTAENVVEGDWRCGNDDFAMGGEGEFADPHLASNIGDSYQDPTADPNMLCEIAFDADYEFYGKNGNSVPNTVADIEAVLNDVDAIYDADVDVVYEITEIIVRSSSNDPYTTSDPEGLLTQFRNEWNNNQRGVQRDIAHMMTGRNLSGSVIGIAYLSVICSGSTGYGLSESRFSSSMYQRAGLTAHELGHNWSAGHCSGSSCYIMCPSLGGCGRHLDYFGTQAINSITRHRDSRNCLEEAYDFRLDVSPLFAGQNADFDISAGAPNSSVAVYYSVFGTGNCYVANLDVTLNLDRCKEGLTGVTDSNGDAHWTTRIPNVKTPRVIWIHAGMFQATSNEVTAQIN
ncbi:MAG: hypothetical protein HND57_07780 [Planctomycetes bacterium]|nr:hypothetical protein [Planctomycetota bacterium]